MLAIFGVRAYRDVLPYLPAAQEHVSSDCQMLHGWGMAYCCAASMPCGRADNAAVLQGKVKQGRRSRRSACELRVLEPKATL
jgi:hypothetical protein